MLDGKFDKKVEEFEDLKLYYLSRLDKFKVWSSKTVYGLRSLFLT